MTRHTASADASRTAPAAVGSGSQARDAAFLWLDRLDEAVRARPYDCTCQVGGVDAMSIDTDWLREGLARIRDGLVSVDSRALLAERELDDGS